MDHQRVANAVRKLCPTLELSDSAAVEAGKLVKSNLREIIKTARVFARKAKRTSLTTEDINFALGIHGFEPVYGSQRFLDQRLTPVEGKDIFFAQDADISTQQASHVVLPKPPSSIHVHSHWLSIEGKQPQVPENEAIVSTHILHKSQNPSTQAKDSSGKKRKNMNLVHNVLGGITQSGVELRLPVEHVLTAEQQAYFDTIQKLIEPIAQGKEQEMNKEHILQTIDGLQFDAALQSLVPYLIRFALQQIHQNLKNLWTIDLTLRMLRSLVRNRHLELGIYSHHILPLVLSCLLSETLGDPTINNLGDVRKTRELAAKVLATAISNFDDTINNLHCRICQTLSDCLGTNKSYVIQYGAVKGLDAIGAVEIPAVKKVLKDRLEFLAEEIAKLPTASTESLDATACQSLIMEILIKEERTTNTKEEEKSGEVLSPLQKRARLDDRFI